MIAQGRGDLLPMKRMYRYRSAALSAACFAVIVAGCSVEPSTATHVTQLGMSFYVYPGHGSDVPTAGTPDSPWNSVNYAAARIAALPTAQRAGAVLHLHAGVMYPPSTFPAGLAGTAAQPIIVQPWEGNTIIFDAGIPELRVQPNSEWEEVGAQGEWRTRRTFEAQGNRYASGQMMATKHRLISYAELGDLRADNESLVTVPFEDPRTEIGRLLDDPDNTIPFVYLGPGVGFVFEDATQARGKIHIRLSHTHLNAPGITDYTGETDPNRMQLSIARKDAVALTVASQHVVFKNVVIQNGGDTTLAITSAADSVTFDHCTVYGARWGVRIGGANAVRFVDCLFDGGLAPWTMRSDVKEEYTYIGPDDCTRDERGRCFNALGTKTHDILVIHSGASNSTYERCTFRRAHDGLQLSGHDIEVKHSLFEDLNDETWQFVGSNVNVKVHDNLVRQALNPLSFAVNPTGGPIYVYRNVVDQRVPTRGHRRLPPDADKPWIWRYGSDVKNGAMPALHIYQNTFLSSNEIDKGSWVSLLFADEPTAPRSYLNNIHLALDLDRPLSRLPDSAMATSAGNVWYRFHGSTTPLFHREDTDYHSFAELHAAYPEWEKDSLYRDPQLANFTDEYFDLASGQPNTDYRPIANVGGKALPPGLPDNPDYAGTIHAGALPANALALAVGVDGATVLPAPGVPIARAGGDQTVVDANSDGFETISLDGRASTDPEGGALSYRWFEDGVQIATGATPTLLLAEGKHVLHLAVTDPSGKVDSDAVIATIAATQPGENRLANPGFESADLADWSTPIGVSITTVPIEVHSGTRALKLVQNGALQEIKQRVAITPGTTYLVSAWLRTQSLTPVFATLTANVLRDDGIIIESRQIARVRGNSAYTYRFQSIAIAADSEAVAIELIGSVDGAGAGTVFIDDLRIRDRNLLRNGGFETRSPDGQVSRAPGWSFVRAGRVEAVPDRAHGARRSLAMDSAPSYQLVTQEIPHVPGRQYRLTAWIRTDNGADTPATVVVRRRDADGVNRGTLRFAEDLSPGEYILVERTLTTADLPPATTASLTIEVRFDADLRGTARFDDFMLEPLP